MLSCATHGVPGLRVATQKTRPARREKTTTARMAIAMDYRGPQQHPMGFFAPHWQQRGDAPMHFFAPPPAPLLHQGYGGQLAPQHHGRRRGGQKHSRGQQSQAPLVGAGGVAKPQQHRRGPRHGKQQQRHQGEAPRFAPAWRGRGHPTNGAAGRMFSRTAAAPWERSRFSSFAGGASFATPHAPPDAPFTSRSGSFAPALQHPHGEQRGV